MCLATFVAYGAGEENLDTRGTAMEMIRTYRGCCAQCLVLSDYTKPGPYTVETLLIYLEGEFILSKDDQGLCYLLIGNAVRLALRMGLHRDPTKVGGNITPFQGELRRRVWHLLVQIDLLASFHIGLPGMVQGIESDNFYPRNLRDEDFSEDSIELPPSRPETEMTPMSYTICKGRICHVFGKIATQVNLLSLPTYDEVMKLDRLLHEADSQIPSFLRMKSLELSITDSPELIIQRFSIALLYQKSRCMLHRRYLTKEKECPTFSYSKKVGLEAAMELLSYQSSVHEAALPGGPLSKDRWFLSSLSMHDFLLAAMIVYYCAAQLTQGSPHNGNASSEKFQILWRDMVNALQKSHAVWADTKTMSAASKKAFKVVGLMLKNINVTASHVLSGSNLVGDSEGAFANIGGPDVISRLSLQGMSKFMFLLHLSAFMLLQLSFFIPLFHATMITMMAPRISTLICSQLDFTPPTTMNSNYDDSNDLWQLGASDRTTPLSGFGMQLDLDPMSMPLEPLEAMIDMPATFDWVSPISKIWKSWSTISIYYSHSHILTCFTPYRIFSTITFDLGLNKLQINGLPLIPKILHFKPTIIMAYNYFQFYLITECASTAPRHTFTEKL